jgi:nucleoside-diphosphate-sugar epimerase
MASKPRVLILGGVGMIGRNLVTYLVSNNFCSYIRVADKMIPIISYLSKEHSAAFEVVNFQQCDLNQDNHVERAFAVNESDGPFDIVINLAAETRYGLEDEMYKQKCFDLSIKCATAALKMGVKKYVEVSTGQVYKSSKSPSSETAATKPWTKHATYKFQAEEVLRAMVADGLPLVVVRLATVYGKADVAGLMPRVVIAAAYKQLEEKMKFLWGASLQMSTVHVVDVCRGLWHLAGEAGVVGSTYNLADKGNTTQGKVCDMLASLFGESCDSPLYFLMYVPLSPPFSHLLPSLYFLCLLLLFCSLALLLSCSLALLLSCSLARHPSWVSRHVNIKRRTLKHVIRVCHCERKTSRAVQFFSQASRVEHKLVTVSRSRSIR